MHVEEPLVETSPGPQLTQDDLSTLGTVPALHAKHVEDAVTEAYLPLSQSEQVAELALLYFPVGQEVQVPLPADDLWPAAQDRQDSSPVVAYFPASQSPQPTAAEASENFPVGQSEHVAAPAPEL